MNDTPLSFVRPELLWLCLLALPLLLIRLWARRTAGKGIRLWLAESLLPSHLKTGSPALGWIRFVLLLLAFCLFVIAVAGPRKGEKEDVVSAEGRSLVIALDVSKSMLAPDVHPSRLARAKLAAQDLVMGIPGDQVGVIAFAGLPFLQAPLTSDHGAVLETLQQLDTRTIPRGGTNLSAALEEAEETFERSGVGSSAIVIFSDGGELEGEAIEMARKLGEKGAPIIAVGVGTELGELIPDPRSRGGGTRYVEDREGRPVHSRLERSVLEEIAKASGGLYLDLNAGTVHVNLVKQLLDRIESEHLGEERRTVPIERYRWPLAAGLFFLLLARLLGTRFASRSQPRGTPSLARAVSLIIVAVLLFSSGQGFASEPRKSLQEGDYETAEQGYQKLSGRFWNLFQRDRISLGEANAAYGKGDYEKAADLFGKNLHRKEHRGVAQYNLANSLYQLGQASEEIDRKVDYWKSSLEHYESVLSRTPDHREAQENAEFVKRKLEEIAPEESEEEQEGEEESKEQEGEENEEGEDQENGEKPEDGSEEKEGEDGDESEEPQDGENEDGGEGENQDQQGNSEDQPSEEGEEGEPNGEENQGAENPSDEENPEGDQSNPERGEGEEADEGDQPQPEGELTTDESEKEGEETPVGKAGEGQEGSDQTAKAPEQVNPETGFTPSRARALLREHADEVSTTPYRELIPFQAERYNDW